jgi:diguanylate cyclase (GGDEF)-like protein/PAS domain S-box-containing protein
MPLHLTCSPYDKGMMLEGLFDLCPLGIVLTDRHGQYIEFNEAFREICGYPAAELKIQHCRNLPTSRHAPDAATQTEGAVNGNRQDSGERQCVRKDGTLIDTLFNSMPIMLGDGQEYVLSIVENISTRKQRDAGLKIAAVTFEAPVTIMLTDRERRIIQVNAAFTAETGYAAAEAIGQTPRLLNSGRQDAVFFAAMTDSLLQKGTWQGEIWNRRKSGEIYLNFMTITVIKAADGSISNYISTQTDVSESKAAAEEILHLAFYDALTRLPNRRLLLDRMRQAMVTSSRTGHAGTLLFIDLDHFKIINDTLGHEEGDILLQQVAVRLVSCFSDTDTVGRLGGDEFVVMQEGLSMTLVEAAAQARAIGEKILLAISKPFLLAGTEYFTTASIGIAMFMDHHAEISELMRRADLAMYQAKATGRNSICFFDPAMQNAVNAHLALELDLRNGMAKHEFLLHFQPQMNEAGRVTGAETLVRWQHPVRGLVYPADFIAVAEDTGQILQLGLWVLETACRQLAEWGAEPETRRLEMSVNISAVQFYHEDFVAQVLTILDSTGANPNLLKLELTESLLLTNFSDIVTKMSALKQRGICFSLDDFGTGYSSLSYLKRLPLDQLKIDQSFVKDIMTDPNDAAIAKTVIALGHALGLSVIAEGVETEEQLSFLTTHGCNAYQGYLFSKPLPIADFALFASLHS